MSSLFDPTNMLDVEVDQPMDTKVVQPPEGRYNWQIVDFEVKKFDAKEAGAKDSYRIEFKCEADASQLAPTGEKVSDLIGRDKFTARYSGWLDLTETGSWDMGKGKNVAVGALREALGMNVPGQPFKVRFMKGQVFNGELYYRSNKENPDQKFGEIRTPLPRQ